MNFEKFLEFFFLKMIKKIHLFFKVFQKKFNELPILEVVLIGAKLIGEKTLIFFPVMLIRGSAYKPPVLSKNEQKHLFWNGVPKMSPITYRL